MAFFGQLYKLITPITTFRANNIYRNFRTIKPNDRLDSDDENDYLTIHALIHASCGSIKYDKATKSFSYKSFSSVEYNPNKVLNINSTGDLDHDEITNTSTFNINSFDNTL